MPGRIENPSWSREAKLVAALLLLSLLTGCRFEEHLKDIPLLGGIYRLPDIDQRFADIPVLNLLLTHRSILTHNALIPLVVAWMCRPLKKLGVPIALVPGTLFAIHFLLDLFPKGWYGHAWIHLPLLIWTQWLPKSYYFIPTVFSIFWLAINMLVAQFSFLLILKQNEN